MINDNAYALCPRGPEWPIVLRSGQLFGLLWPFSEQRLLLRPCRLHPFFSGLLLSIPLLGCVGRPLRLLVDDKDPTHSKWPPGPST